MTLKILFSKRWNFRIHFMMKLNILRWLSQTLIMLTLKNARHNREVTYQLVLYFNCIILWNLEKIPQLSFNYNFSCIVAMRIDQYDCIELYRFVKHLSVKDNASNICFWFRDLILSDIKMTKHWHWNMITFYWWLSLKSLIHLSNVFQILLHSFLTVFNPSEFEVNWMQLNLTVHTIQRF